jgi:hypothetical protein
MVELVDTLHLSCRSQTGVRVRLPLRVQNETDRSPISTDERNLGFMGVATQPKCEMTQDTLFRTLLCVATQQVMGNKPSVKTRMKGQFHFLSGCRIMDYYIRLPL